MIINHSEFFDLISNQDSTWLSLPIGWYLKNCNVSEFAPLSEVTQVDGSLILDEKLTFLNHVDENIKDTTKAAGILRYFRNYLPLNTLRQIYKMFIRPHFDSGDVIYHIPIRYVTTWHPYTWGLIFLKSVNHCIVINLHRIMNTCVIPLNTWTAFSPMLSWNNLGSAFHNSVSLSSFLKSIN